MPKPNGPALRGKKTSAIKAPLEKRATPSAPALERNLSKLKEIVKILESSSLAELRYEDTEIAVEVRRHASGSSPVVTMSAPPVASFASAAPTRTDNGTLPPERKPVEDPNLFTMRSPFVGTFYAAPSPGADNFTDAGKAVRKGQTVCIIEAMKLMNEIESEVDGTVVEIVAENGKPVQYGDALFRIRTK